MEHKANIDTDGLVDDSKPDDSLYSDLAIEHQVLRYLMTAEPQAAQFINEQTIYGKYERFILKQLRNIQAVLPPETLRKVLLAKTDDENFDAVDQTLTTILEADSLESDGGLQAAVEYIRGLATQRIVRDAAQAAEAYNRRGEVKEAMDAMRMALAFESRQTIDSGDYLEDFEYRRDLQIARAETADTRPSVIPTGVLQFDEQSGGLLRGEVGVLIAETGGGKSVGKLNFAISAWHHNFNVVHVGLEMSKTENQFRMDSALASIDALSFRLAKLKQDDLAHWAATIDKYRKARENYIEFVSGRGMKMQDILALVESIENKRKRKCDLLILDHIKLVVPKNPRMDEREHLGESFMELSVWAQRRSIGTWTSTQSTDEGVNRKDGMRTTDIKYSRFIAETAQVIMALYQRDVDKVSNEMQLKIIKGRGIRKNQTFTIKPDFDRMVLDKQSFITLGHRTHRAVTGEL